MLCHVHSSLKFFFQKIRRLLWINPFIQGIEKFSGRSFKGIPLKLDLNMGSLYSLEKARINAWHFRFFK